MPCNAMMKFRAVVGWALLCALLPPVAVIAPLDIGVRLEPAWYTGAIAGSAPAGELAFGTASVARTPWL